MFVRNNQIIVSSISRIANRMATLRRQLYNELGNTKLMQAMDAVSLDDEDEMWKRLNEHGSRILHREFR